MKVLDRNETTQSKRGHRVSSTVLFVLGVVAVALFFYYDRHNALSSELRSWGIPGICVAIVLMAVICMTPIPSESLLLLYLKVYGPGLGVFYSWLGSILSSVIVFYLARTIGQPILQKFVTPRRFRQMSRWVRTNGIQGLIFLRLLPIPGFMVSYVLGTIPSINLWTFVWTAAVTVIPYYVGATLIYLGVSTDLKYWLAIGCVALAGFWGLGYFAKKKWTREEVRRDQVS